MQYKNIGFEQFIEKLKIDKPGTIYFDRHFNRCHFWHENNQMTLFKASDIVIAFEKINSMKIKIIGVDYYYYG
jgi:hypothetical protein